MADWGPMETTTREGQRPAIAPPVRQAWNRIARRRAHREPRWWHEVLLVVVGYGIYSLIRDGVPTEEASAVLRAFDVIHLEQGLHVFYELTFNHIVAADKPLAEVFDYYYATAHFGVTIAVAVWVLTRHRHHARQLRIAFYGMNALGLVGFALFPMAPPRLTTGAGFVDTIVDFHTWGSYGSGGIDSISNQYAAMPSLHLGWALWCGVVIFMLARRRWVRGLGLLYPLVTFAVIIGTGNHFFLDSAAGVLTTAGGFAIQRVITGGPAFGGPELQRRARRAALDPAVGATGR